MRAWASDVTGGGAVYPLLVLFGLNAVDELDRVGFSVLLPDIRDHFGLGDAGALAIVAVSNVAVILISVPLSFWCDRANRVRIATIGASVWALFSVGTGLAVNAFTLVVARIGAGTGRAVNEPTHNSLLSDWYPPETRVKVFSVHRLGNSVGQIAGPLLAGGLAWAFGWRTPFIFFAVPTAIVVLAALRLHEPVRGAHERRAAGADDAAAAVEEEPEGVWGTFRTLGRVGTIRRVWWAIPLLAVALFGVPNVLSLVYEDIYGLNSLQRGLVAAGVEPLQIVGVLTVMPWLSRRSGDDPGYLLRFVGVIGVVDALLLVLLANAPNLATAIAVHALLAASIGVLAPAFFSILSFVIPPRVRAAGFSTIAVFAVPGLLIVLPVMGAVSDRYGLQASTLVMVPVAIAAGLILASARRFLVPDVDRARAEALARLAT
ncbi:MAG: MFS transporter [Actinobacteria bacterium]|nr:MFS transporter [Actinomycetota bacterium]